MGQCSAPNPDMELLVQQEDQISKSQLSQEHSTSLEAHKSPASLALTVEPEEPKLDYGGDKIALELVAELKEHEKELLIAEARLVEAEGPYQYWSDIERTCNSRMQYEGQRFAQTRLQGPGHEYSQAKSVVSHHQDQIKALQIILMQIKERQEGKSGERTIDDCAGLVDARDFCGPLPSLAEPTVFEPIRMV
jgi:hypothetical protein